MNGPTDWCTIHDRWHGSCANGLADSEYPLTEQQKIALAVDHRRREYPDRCNHYRAGYGTCVRRTLGRPRWHDGPHSYISLDRILAEPSSRKEPDTMSISSAHIAAQLREIEAQEASLLRRKEALLGEAERRAALPKEPDKDTVIRFQLQYTGDGIVYTVVAFRSGRPGASWHTTLTKRPGPYSWDDLLDVMQEDYAVKNGHRTLEFFQYNLKGTWVRA